MFALPLPQRTFALLSYLLLSQKKLFFEWKRKEWKERKDLIFFYKLNMNYWYIFFQLRIHWQEKYLQVHKKTLNEKRNVYDFLIKNTFICWTRLKIEKLLGTAKQLITPPAHFDSVFKDSPPSFTTNVILKVPLITTTSIFPTLNLHYYVVGRLANSMFQFKNWERVLCHTK